MESPIAESTRSGPAVATATSSRTRRVIWRRLLVLGALALLVVGLRLTILAPAPVPVTVFRVARGRVEETVTNSRAGTVKSRHRASLSPELGGRVAELAVRAGSQVKAGQLLIRLNDADYRAQVAVQARALEAAQSAEVEACRASQLADRQLTRHESLAVEKILSRELLDQSESQRDMAAASCEAAKARIRQARAALDAAEATLAKTVLRAPFDGVVAEVATEVGEWITPSPPGIPIPTVLQLLDPDTIYVSAPMDEVDVGKVRVGQAVRLTIDAYPGESWGGRVSRVAPYVLDIKEQNRTFEIEVELSDAVRARELRPGTSADVEVILASRDGVLRLPAYALIEGQRVLVVRGGKLVSAAVKTGLKNWAFAEVRDGLREGDAVVVSLDRVEVKEGAKVRIESETVK